VLVTVVAVLVLLASVAPAQAAPRPLAYSQSQIESALAGDLAVYTRGSSGYAVPTADGPARRILSFGNDTQLSRISASPTRAAIAVIDDRGPGGRRDERRTRRARLAYGRAAYPCMA
jgi:hypothetical protein